MNNEIKDILNNLAFNVYHTNNWKKPLGLKQETWKQLLSYITNLQQENERLKEERHRLLYNLEKVCEEDEEDEDCKSRIDKAIEYIEKEYNKYNKEFDSFQWWLDDLLNILRGKDNE